MQQYPGSEVQFTLSRLEAGALSWFESTLGRQSADGSGISKEAFIAAFLERYVTDSVATTARRDLEALRQLDKDILTFNEEFSVAVEFLKLNPDDDGVTGTTASGYYLIALNNDIRSRLSAMLPDMHKHPLPVLMGKAALAQKAIDVERGFQVAHKSATKQSRPAPVEHPVSEFMPVEANAVPLASDSFGQGTSRHAKRRRARKA